MFRLRTQIIFPVIARVLGVHMSILNRGINCFLAPKRYYDEVATYIEVKTAEELEIAQSVGASMYMKIPFSKVKETYFDVRGHTHYLPSEITAGPIKKPKMLVLGKEQESFTEEIFNYSTDGRNSHHVETWGFSRNATQFDHWTPGADEEDENDVNSVKGSYSNDFPSKTSMVHNADGKPECFDIVALALSNWSNRSCYNRENIDWAEDKLRVGGVMILSGKHYHLKNLTRVLVSRFESIQIYSYNEHCGIFGSNETVTLVGVKKAKRSRDDAFAELLTATLTPDKSGYGMKQTVHPVPYHSVYPPESVTIIEEHKHFDDDHLIEMEEVEAMLTSGDGYGVDTYAVRQKVDGISECKMAIGTSFGYHVKLKGSSVPLMRQVCSDLEYKVRFKGEKSSIERTIREEARDTNLAADNLTPVILSKETDYQYMSLFAHESPLRLHGGLLQKKTEQDMLILPVPPKITNLTKLTQHLRGVVQGPDNYWLATKGTVETVETNITTETDGEVLNINTTRKRVKQVGIILDGPDKGAIIEVEAA